MHHCDVNHRFTGGREILHILSTDGIDTTRQTYARCVNHNVVIQTFFLRALSPHVLPFIILVRG